MTPPSTPPTVITDVPRLPPRPADAHKGTFGKVLVIGGSTGMSGAAVLCGCAALRGGAGLVQIAVPEPVAGVVAAANPCYMTAALPADGNGRLASAALPTLLDLAEQASAVVAGPGLGNTPDVATLIRGLITETQVPLVLDADALNVLAPDPSVLRQRGSPLVLTPHPGEFARLTGTDTRSVQANRQDRAVSFALSFGVVVVLKGAATVVTDGRRVYVNTTGNPGMATGGSGDVLAGLLAALLAQRMEAFPAAILGVYVHGLAGDLARDSTGEVSLIATDIVDNLPAALRR